MNLIKTLKLISLLVSFACAAKNDAAFPPLTDSHLLTAGTDEQLTAEEIFQIIFKPLPPGIRFSNYDFHSDFPLPYEICLEVFSHTDPMAIWNFGLTCKWAAALIRDNKIRLDLIWAVPENIGHLLLNGELRLHNWAANILEPMLQNWAVENVQNFGMLVTPFHSNVSAYPELWEPLYQKWYQLCSRSADLKISQLAFQVFNLDSFHLSCLIPTSDHMYRDIKAFSRLFYLPPNDGIPLLQRIDPRLIAAMVYNKFSHQESKKFAIPILLDYVIPSFYDWNMITSTERAMLCFILPQQYNSLKDYMEYLLWALYLLTGTLRKNEKTLIRHIVNHFESFNLDWKKLCGCRTAVRTFQSQKDRLDEHQVRAIYIVAKQWKLDLTKIARNSSWLPLSQQILSGNLPDFLANDAPSLSCMDLYKTIYRVEAFKLRIEGSEIFYEQVDDPSKRKAVKDLDEEPVAKRQKLDEAPTQSPAETFMMPHSNQIQMEINAATQAHPSQYAFPTNQLVVDNNVSNEQLVGEIMSKIAWLRQIIPNPIAHMNQQGSAVDLNYFVQTLNSLQSTAQNILPQINFCQPQFQYHQGYGQDSYNQAPVCQHAPVYPQVQQMHYYTPQVQQMHAFVPQIQPYVPQFQQMQNYEMPIQQQFTYQHPVPQSSQLVQGFTNMVQIENFSSNQENASARNID